MDGWRSKRKVVRDGPPLPQKDSAVQWLPASLVPPIRSYPKMSKEQPEQIRDEGTPVTAAAGYAYEATPHSREVEVRERKEAEEEEVDTRNHMGDEDSERIGL